MNLDTAWLAAALVGGALALAALTALVLAIRSRRRLGRRLDALERELEALRANVATSTAIGVRVGERLRRVDQVSAQMNDRLGQLEVRGDGRPYDHAIALVRHGADADRLVRHFGLSRGEADLVSLVHGRRKAG
jgi:hypothetical protein